MSYDSFMDAVISIISNPEKKDRFLNIVREMSDQQEEEEIK